MRYCTHCGTEISENVKFCPECGIKVEAIIKYNPEQRKAYAGKVIKCPNCEGVLNAFTMKCPYCGYELQGVKPLDSLQEFSEKLGKTTNTEKQITLIRNFPIPNTKEDLFEFVNLAASNIDISFLDNDIPDTNPKKALAKAWKAKLDQVYTKAIMLFDEHDTHFIKIKQIYEATQTKLYKQKQIEARKYTVGFIITISGTIIALVLIVLGIIIGTLGDHSMDSSRANLVIFIGGVIQIVVAAMSNKGEGGVVAPLGSAFGCVIAIIIGMIYPMVDKSWSMISSRSAQIILFAVIALILSVVNIIRTASAKYGNKY